MLRSTSPLLSKAFVDEDFSFVQAQTGQKEMRARWKRWEKKWSEADGFVNADETMWQFFEKYELPAHHRG